MTIGEKLIQAGYITEEELYEALKQQQRYPRERIGEILIRLGYITKNDIEDVI